MGCRLDCGARQQCKWIQRSKSFVLDFDESPERIWSSDFKTKYRHEGLEGLKGSKWQCAGSRPHRGHSTEAGELELSPGSAELCHTGIAGVRGWPYQRRGCSITSNKAERVRVCTLFNQMNLGIWSCTFSRELP